MRNLARNTEKVYFKNLLGAIETEDEYGNPTGSPEPLYSDLQEEMLSVSPHRGNLAFSPFGALEDYDRTMTTSNVNCLIDEQSILWLDGIDTDDPHNYFVKKVARWKNSVSYAIKKVTVSE